MSSLGLILVCRFFYCINSGQRSSIMAAGSISSMTNIAGLWRGARFCRAETNNNTNINHSDDSFLRKTAGTLTGRARLPRCVCRWWTWAATRWT